MENTGHFMYTKPPTLHDVPYLFFQMTANKMLLPPLNTLKILTLLQNRKIIASNNTPIWENTYGCDKKYRFETALYLLSMLGHANSITIEHGVGYPGQGREAMYDLNPK